MYLILFRIRIGTTKNKKENLCRFLSRDALSNVAIPHIYVVVLLLIFDCCVSLNSPASVSRSILSNEKDRLIVLKTMTNSGGTAKQLRETLALVIILDNRAVIDVVW